jgi:hypothetical protein
MKAWPGRLLVCGEGGALVPRMGDGAEEEEDSSDAHEWSSRERVLV